MEMSASITMTYGMTVEDLKAILDNVPVNATVNVSSHAGDRNEGDWHTMTFDWKSQ